MLLTVNIPMTVEVDRITDATAGHVQAIACKAMAIRAAQDELLVEAPFKILNFGQYPVNPPPGYTS